VTGYSVTGYSGIHEAARCCISNFCVWHEADKLPELKVRYVRGADIPETWTLSAVR